MGDAHRIGPGLCKYRLAEQQREQQKCRADVMHMLSPHWVQKCSPQGSVGQVSLALVSALVSALAPNRGASRSLSSLLPDAMKDQWISASERCYSARDLR